MEEKKNIDDLRNLTIEDTLKLFKADLTTGLKVKDVEIYIKKYGYNEVPEKKSNPLLKFLAKFWGLTAWMLELIIVLSWILHKESDAYVVMGLLVFNAIIGFFQEQNAANALDLHLYFH